MDRRTIEIYNEKAADYAFVFASDKPSDWLTAFMALLPGGGRVLDLGCGPGISANHMLQAGFDVDAMDASPEMVRMANQHFPLDAYVASFDDLTALEAYDGVWANFSLLHAPRAKFSDHLKQIHAAMKPRGILHIGMKIGTGEKRDRFGRFYTFYSAEALGAHLSEAGFALIEKREGSEKGLAGSDDPFALMLARKS